MKKLYYGYDLFINDTQILVDKCRDFKPEILLAVARGGLTLSHLMAQAMNIRNLYAFPSIVEQAGQTYSPALIANYVYELAKSFNAFYQDTPILKEENKSIIEMRVSLANFVGNTIKIAMNLLGIKVPERM